MVNLQESVGLSNVFGRHAKRHPDTFNHSIAYYLLTGRNGLKVYSHEDAYVVTCKHPHLSDVTLIFPEIGGNGLLTARVLSKFKDNNQKLQLARYTNDDLKNLQSALAILQNDTLAEILPINETIMDWSYPGRILDTSLTGAMSGKAFDKLRNKYNKAKAKLEIVPFDQIDAQSALKAALYFWLGGMVYAKKETGHSLSEFYESLLENLRLNPSLFDGFITLHDKEPAGFMIWDRSVKGSANSLAGLSRRSIQGMSEFQTVAACRILSEQGIKFYNLGGSETAELDRHKLEYRPIKSIEMASYSISMRNSECNSIQEVTLV